MQISELIIIFLIGAALGVIARYILGYRKRHVGYVALNVIFGGAVCVFCHILWGSNVYALFLSGAGGIIFNFAYCILQFIF